jgi:thiol-disulfide isomerase/thioredoxin
MPDTVPRSFPFYRRARVIWGAGLIAASVGFADIHSALAQSPCAQALALSSKIAPLVKGEIGALTVATKPVQLPDLAFQDAAGSPRKLSDWKGRTVLLNLWATRCVPCRKEMPALDNLQGKLGSKNFEVVAVNIDTRDPDKPKAFLKDGNLLASTFLLIRKPRCFKILRVRD